MTGSTFVRIVPTVHDGRREEVAGPVPVPGTGIGPQGSNVVDTAAAVGVGRELSSVSGLQRRIAG